LARGLRESEKEKEIQIRALEHGKQVIQGRARKLPMSVQVNRQFETFNGALRKAKKIDQE
jgi:hypothetical protein